MSDIMAFDPARRTSAQAIADLATLGYLNEDQLTLDATYGKGRFWKKWRPNKLWTNDVDPDRVADFDLDYRSLPNGKGTVMGFPSADWTGMFDVTVFDPPFKLNGTGGSHASDEAYGVATPYVSLNDIWDDCKAGFGECLRVTRPGGLVIFKTQDQVSGGKKRPLTKQMWVYAGTQLGALLVDELYITGYRKQPKRKCKACKGTGNEWEGGMPRLCPKCDGAGEVECPQQHSRSNVSVLQVFKKGK